MTQTPTVEGEDPNQVPLLVRAAPGQAAYVAAMQDSEGNIVFAIDAQGNVYSTSTVTLVGSGVSPYFTWDSKESEPYPSTPAIGTDFSYQLPAGFRYRLESFNWELETSATVADRHTSFQIFHGTRMIMQFPQGLFSVQQAGQDNFYACSLGMPYMDGSNLKERFTMLPYKLDLAAGLTLKTVTTDLQSNDQVDDVGWLLRKVPL